MDKVVKRFRSCPSVDFVKDEEISNELGNCLI